MEYATDIPGRVANWETLAAAFLRDAPDKALSISGHDGRGAAYLARMLGDRALRGGVGPAPVAPERLPTPAFTTAIENGRLWVRHPMSSELRYLQVPAVEEAAVADVVGNIVEGIVESRARFLAVWRLLPERLGRLHRAYRELPADAGVPDHTVWNQADAVTGLTAVAASGAQSAALLSFALAPVQAYIGAARSLRDLRNGSILLSWLAFRGMAPVIECLGPTALIFPELRGNPLFDMWLRRQAGLTDRVRAPCAQALLTPSLPNRFLAIVPAGPATTWAHAMADACEEAVRIAWREVANAVHARIEHKAGREFPGWDRHWETQVDGYWDITTSVVPLATEGGDDAIAALFGKSSFGEAFPDAARIRRLGERIGASTGGAGAPTDAGRWQAGFELSGRAVEACRSIRHVPPSIPSDGPIPLKCSLHGSFERMGPADFAGSAAFFDRFVHDSPVAGVRLRKGERFSAIALIKRFAMEAHLHREFGVDRGDLEPFPDTATLAAALWLQHLPAPRLGGLANRSDWNGQWLHWPRPGAADGSEGEEPCPPDTWDAIRAARAAAGPPPAYLAVLALDGDRMGDWLRGTCHPPITLQDTYHPAVVDHLRDMGAADELRAQRPVTPALHAAISKALSNFSCRIAPAIVRKHSGALVYAGGDDVLALLPTASAIACARELEQAFRGDPDRNGGAPAGYYRIDDGESEDLLVMGPRASVSAGIAVVHYKEDLRRALGLAHAAERAAKVFGRNAVHLAVARRSGERAGVSLPWTELDRAGEAVGVFMRGASDRWLYRLRGLLPHFSGTGALPVLAFRSELRRQLGRSEDCSLFGGPDAVDGAFVALCDALAARRASECPISSFLTLWQSASFLARGREA